MITPEELTEWLSRFGVRCPRCGYTFVVHEDYDVTCVNPGCDYYGDGTDKYRRYRATGQ